jgi:hypothetical protein
MGTTSLDAQFDALSAYKKEAVTCPHDLDCQHKMPAKSAPPSYPWFQRGF